jgi:hypothetical protein
MHAVEFFYSQHQQHLTHLNSDHIVLIPKKEDAQSVSDFRPISLTHLAAKLFSKILANRLAPELNMWVSRVQSAFIKRRSIQDNFLYTQNLIKSLHRAKQSGLFLKLDISKAFDTVCWDFLLEVLQQFGFGTRWRGWWSALLSTASTSVLLNGARGRWFKHYVGLRQGDPLSPMLFILAMEPLQRLLDVATHEQLLTPLSTRVATLRFTMYADDAAIFLNPIKEEVHVVAGILYIFGHASGLITNRSKCAVYPINCESLDVVDVMEGFTCPIKTFPCNYLGLPLQFRALHRVEVQPLIDKMGKQITFLEGQVPKQDRKTKTSQLCANLNPHVLYDDPCFKEVGHQENGQDQEGLLVEGVRLSKWRALSSKVGQCSETKTVKGLGVLDLEVFGRSLRLR